MVRLDDHRDFQHEARPAKTLIDTVPNKPMLLTALRAAAEAQGVQLWMGIEGPHRAMSLPRAAGTSRGVEALFPALRGCILPAPSVG